MKITKLDIDLRGSKFRFGIGCLHKRPETLLGRIGGVLEEYNDADGDSDNDPASDHDDVLVERVKGLCDAIEDVRVSGAVLEVEMNRTPVLFHYILDLYVRDSMHLPAAFCAKLVHEEMTFWGVSERKLVTCCWAKLREEQEKQVTLQRVQEEWGIYGTPDDIKYTPSKHFLEGPIVTRKALIYSWVQLLAVFMSVLGLTLETIPELREASVETQHNYTSMSSGRLEYFFKNSRPAVWLRLIDALVIVSIMIDCIARFSVSSRKRRFFLNAFNIIDMLVIVPSLIVFSLNMIGTTSGYSEELTDVIFVLNIVRVFRVLRIFRLMTHYKSLKILLWAWKTSYRELVLLLVILCLFCCIYGSLVFYVEIVYDNFMNIPQGLWWAVVTMTTVGYGDMHPVSIGGYFVGTVCAITGLVVVAMPVPIIVQNFGRYYYAVQTCERLQQQQKSASSRETDEASCIVNGGVQLKQANEGEQRF